MPLKYFWLTMLVAFWDQPRGNSNVWLFEGHRPVGEVLDTRRAALPHEVVVGWVSGWVLRRSKPIAGPCVTKTWISSGCAL